jgi:hypothetical protein
VVAAAKDNAGPGAIIAALVFAAGALGTARAAGGRNSNMRA